MIAVDTSALIAILQDEPEASEFLDILKTNDACVIGSPTQFEALLVAAKRPTGQADIRLLLTRAGVDTIDWTQEHANVAAEAFLRFGKGRHPAALNFGDCMAYAVAKSLDAPLLFKGDDFSQTDIRSAP